jgi:hypothetical protein
VVHDALVLAGLTEEEARRWLEGARSAGMETRFTLSQVQSVPLWSFLRLQRPDQDLPA